ncbi:hypothetical protein [Bosea sp. NPDC055594]
MIIEMLLEKGVISKNDVVNRMLDINSLDQKGTSDEGLGVAPRLILAWLIGPNAKASPSPDVPQASNLPMVLTGQTASVIALIRLLIKKGLISEEEIKTELNDLILDGEKEVADAGYDTAAKHIIRWLEGSKG